MTMTWEMVAVRLGIAVLMGAAVGFERQWRNRYVGLRTSTLIALGSAAFTLIALLLPDGEDATALGRVIGHIIAGAGFLCAGAIIHAGSTAKGLNTAATLWCSIAIGIFAGMGQFIPAGMLAAMVVVINLLLRPAVHLINEKSAGEEGE